MNGVQVYRKHEINESEGRDKPGTLEWLAPRRSEALLMSEVYFGGVGWSVHCAQNIHSIEDNSWILLATFTMNWEGRMGRSQKLHLSFELCWRTPSLHPFPPKRRSPQN